MSLQDLQLHQLPHARLLQVAAPAGGTAPAWPGSDLSFPQVSHLQYDRQERHLRQLHQKVPSGPRRGVYTARPVSGAGGHAPPSLAPFSPASFIPAGSSATAGRGRCPTRARWPASPHTTRTLCTTRRRPSSPTRCSITEAAALVPPSEADVQLTSHTGLLTHLHTHILAAIRTWRDSAGGARGTRSQTSRRPAGPCHGLVPPLEGAAGLGRHALQSSHWCLWASRGWEVQMDVGSPTLASIHPSPLLPRTLPASCQLPPTAAAQAGVGWVNVAGVCV